MPSATRADRRVTAGRRGASAGDAAGARRADRPGGTGARAVPRPPIRDHAYQPASPLAMKTGREATANPNLPRKGVGAEYTAAVAAHRGSGTTSHPCGRLSHRRGTRKARTAPETANAAESPITVRYWAQCPRRWTKKAVMRPELKPTAFWATASGGNASANTTICRTEKAA